MPVIPKWIADLIRGGWGTSRKTPYTKISRRARGARRHRKNKAAKIARRRNRRKK